MLKPFVMKSFSGGAWIGTWSGNACRHLDDADADTDTDAPVQLLTPMPTAPPVPMPIPVRAAWATWVLIPSVHCRGTVKRRTIDASDWMHPFVAKGAVKRPPPTEGSMKRRVLTVGV